MVPIWKKAKKDVKDDDYYNFYKDRFYDYENPLRIIRSSVEGILSYDALLFIPSHASMDYYTKEYEKGLELYSKGVLITNKCSDLLEKVNNYSGKVVFVSLDKFDFETVEFVPDMDKFFSLNFKRKEDSMKFVPDYLKKTEAEEKLHDNRNN